jgi:type II secretory pathway pseudopilin PulG
VNEDLDQPPQRQPRSVTFTLLVALGALALLCYLLFPTISDGPTPATRTRHRARNGAIEITEALRRYYSEYQSLPNGSHHQIIATLSGDNPHQIVFFAIDWEQIRAAGQFLDPWGVPYQIDTSDPTKPRVYSTGPNKQDDKGEPGSDDVVPWR